MTKEITIKVSDKDYDLIQRIAKQEKRKLSDFSYLLFAEGLKFFFCEEVICFKKHDDELAKQEGWYELDYEEKVVQGYKQVFEWWENHVYNHETKKHDDNLIKPTVKSIQSFAVEED